MFAHFPIQNLLNIFFNKSSVSNLAGDFPQVMQIGADAGFFLLSGLKSLFKERNSL